MSFFAFHNFLCSMVLINIIVAILLDSFLLAKERQELQDREREREEQASLGDAHSLFHPLDKILEQLSKYRSDRELSFMIADLYKHMASGAPPDGGWGDEKEGICFEDLRLGLRKLQVHLNRDDWDELVISEADGELLDFKTFDRLIREQLRRYTVRR